MGAVVCMKPECQSTAGCICNRQSPGNWTHAERELYLIRVMLGLNPIHSPVEAVRVLYEDGREAFERMRGDPCDHAWQWKPNANVLP